jgi:hypothetical protein
MGQAQLSQTGGIVSTSWEMDLGISGGTGTYELHDGQLTGFMLDIGQSGQGFLRQHSGTANFDSISIASGRYELMDGTLAAATAGGQGQNMLIASGGQFVLSGGLHTLGSLDNYGSYLWSGGSLQIRNHWSVSGQFAFPATPVALSVDGIVDFSSASLSLTNAANLSLSLTDTSLFIRSASFDPAASFGSFINPGFTHIAGEVLTIPAGRTIHLDDSFNDPIDCFGTVSSNVDSSVNLTSLKTLEVGGYVDTRGGDARAPVGISQILGGEIHAGYLMVEGPSVTPFPLPPPTIMQQSGGSVFAGGFGVGADGVGQYEMSGGTLIAGGSFVGRASEPLLFTGAGTMTQSGGQHISGFLQIGTGDAAGTYTLSGGVLNLGSLLISAPGSGGFGFPPPPPIYGTGRFEVTDAAANISISDTLAFGPNSTYAAVAGTTIHMLGTGGIGNMSTNPDALDGLGKTRFIFDSGSTDPAPIEVAGKDLGPGLSGFASNFAVDTLQIGDATFAAVSLADWVDNQPGFDGSEALYVDHLILGPDSSLFLNGLNLYCLDFVNNGGTVFGGNLTVVPEPGLASVAAATLLFARRRRTVGSAV